MKLNCHIVRFPVAVQNKVRQCPASDVVSANHPVASVEQMNRQAKTC